MPKSQVDSAALAAAALAATVALTLLPGPFAWMASIVGLVLLLVLFGFDQEGFRTVFGSLAFSAVCGLCLAVACGALLQLLGARGEVHLANAQWQTEWLPLLWVFATLLFWALDRSRMSARLSVDRVLTRPGKRPASFIPERLSNDAGYRAPAAPPSTAPESAPAPAPSDAPEFEPALLPTETFEPRNTYSQEPTLDQPVYAEAPPAFSAASSAPSTRPQSMLTPTTSEAVRPAPVPILPRAGKPTTIYVALTGEGLNVLRSVEAEHVGRDYYKIAGEMPEGETWQFQPGQVVRCKKQTLSSGKALVAFEEARRPQ